MYDTGNFYLLVKTREEEFGSQTLDLKKPAKLRLIKSDHFDVEDVIPAISIPEEGPIYLRVTTIRKDFTQNSATPWMEKTIRNWLKSPPTSSPMSKAMDLPALISECTVTI